MKTKQSNNNAHILSVQLEPTEVNEILNRKRPLDMEELGKRSSTRRYSLETFEHLQQNPAEKAYVLPTSVGERLFPNEFFVSKFYCFCIGYKWCLVRTDGPGSPVKLVLKCDYLCFHLIAATPI